MWKKILTTQSNLSFIICGTLFVRLCFVWLFEHRLCLQIPLVKTRFPSLTSVIDISMAPPEFDYVTGDVTRIKVPMVMPLGVAYPQLLKPAFFFFLFFFLCYQVSKTIIPEESIELFCDTVDQLRDVNPEGLIGVHCHYGLIFTLPHFVYLILFNVCFQFDFFLSQASIVQDSSFAGYFPFSHFDWDPFKKKKKNSKIIQYHNNLQWEFYKTKTKQCINKYFCAWLQLQIQTCNFSYLVLRRSISVDDAIELFREARSPGIKHEHFIDALRERYNRLFVWKV